MAHAEIATPTVAANIAQRAETVPYRPYIFVDEHCSHSS